MDQVVILNTACLHSAFVIFLGPLLLQTSTMSQLVVLALPGLIMCVMIQENQP